MVFSSFFSTTAVAALAGVFSSIGRTGHRCWPGQAASQQAGWKSGKKSRVNELSEAKYKQDGNEDAEIPNSMKSIFMRETKFMQGNEGAVGRSDDSR